MKGVVLTPLYFNTFVLPCKVPISQRALFIPAEWKTTIFLKLEINEHRDMPCIAASTANSGRRKENVVPKRISAQIVPRVLYRIMNFLLKIKLLINMKWKCLIITWRCWWGRRPGAGGPGVRRHHWVGVLSPSPSS